MARCRSGAKPLYEPVTAYFTDAYIRQSISMNKVKDSCFVITDYGHTPNFNVNMDK